jgi:hypothetical protein
VELEGEDGVARPFVHQGFIDGTDPKQEVGERIAPAAAGSSIIALVTPGKMPVSGRMFCVILPCPRVRIA